MTPRRWPHSDDPVWDGLRLRPRVYRLAGVPVGTGTVIAGRVRISGAGRPSERLHIGPNCFINDQVWFSLGGDVTIEEGVSIGMECLVLTETHELAGSPARAGRVVTESVVIEIGAWLGARVTLLPGVTVGSGSVVAAGSMVTASVPRTFLPGAFQPASSGVWQAEGSVHVSRRCGEARGSHFEAGGCLLARA